MAYFSRNKSGVTRIKRDGYGRDWYTISREVKVRDNFMCQHVGCSFKENPKEGLYLHVHHVIPLSRGGTTTKANLISLCEAHHSKRHKHM